MCSFDKGFHSPYNQIELAEKLDMVILPKKGKLSQLDKERETSEDFIQGRRQHSAVESDINCLEVHGMDKCPDRGLQRFNSYVALGVVGRNLHHLGVVKIRNKERDELKEEFIESILAKDIADLKPKLNRHGYNVKVLAQAIKP